jgi:hypothetical protein
LAVVVVVIVVAHLAMRRRGGGGSGPPPHGLLDAGRQLYLPTTLEPPGAIFRTDENSTRRWPPRPVRAERDGMRPR